MMTLKLLTVVWLSTTYVKVIEYEPWSLKVIPVILTYPRSPSALIVRDENAAAGVDASVKVGSCTQFGVLLIANVMSCGSGSTPTSSEVLAGGLEVNVSVVTVHVIVILKFLVTAGTIG